MQFYYLLYGISGSYSSIGVRQNLIKKVALDENFAFSTTCKKMLKVRQNASNLIYHFCPAAPVLMRLRRWRKFESKDPYIAGRCGGGTTARAGPKRAFFLHHQQHHSAGREKAASWAARAVAGALWRGWTVAAPPCRLPRRGAHPARPARALAVCSLS